MLCPRASPFETWRLEPELRDSQVGQPLSVFQPAAVWTNQSGLYDVLRLCWVSAFSPPPYSFFPLISPHMQIRTKVSGYMFKTHNPDSGDIPFTCIRPGVNETCPGAHLSKCAISGTQGPFNFNAVIPAPSTFLLFFYEYVSPEIQNKYALHTIWIILSLYLDNHRHF